MSSQISSPKISKASFWCFLTSFFLMIFLNLSPSFSAYVTGMSFYGSPKYTTDAKSLEYSSPLAKPGGHLVVGALGSFDSLNPYIVTGTPAAGLLPLYSSAFNATLMFYTQDEPYSGYGFIAESFEFAQDRLSITFRLRDNAVFHDGSPIRPEDVIFSFKILQEKGNPLYRSYYGNVKEVTKVSKREVKFEFKDATNHELHLIIGQMPILSQTYYQSHNFSKASLEIPVGCGPYKIKHIDPGRSITYERIHNWWGDQIWFNHNRYNFEEIKYQYFRDEDVMFEAFKSEELSYRIENSVSRWMTSYNIPAVEKGAILREDVLAQVFGRMYGLVLNTRKAPFNDLKFREALIYAFDFEWLNENLFYNQYERIDSYFWGLDFAASPTPSPQEIAALTPYKDKIDPRVLTQTFKLPKSDGSGHNRANLQKAKTLLKELGYHYDQGNLIDPKTKKPIELTFLITQGTLKKVLLPYASQLKRLGIGAKVHIVDASQYQARLDSFDFDMIATIIPESPSPGNEQRDFWGSAAAHAQGSRNYAGIKDPVIDDIIEKIIQTQTHPDLVTYVQSLDRLLLWGSYYVPFYGRHKSFFARKRELRLPEIEAKYGMDVMTWWIDPSKTVNLSKQHLN